MNAIHLEIFAKEGSRPLFARIIEIPADLSFDYQKTIETFRSLYHSIDLVIKFSITQIRTK